MRACYKSGTVTAADSIETPLEHAAGVQVRHHQQVGVAGDIRIDPLDARHFGGEGVVEAERAFDDGAGPGALT